MNSFDSRFFVGNVKYPRMLTPVAEEKVLEWLMHANTNVPTIGFEWKTLQRPQPGDIVLYALPLGMSDAAPDGYSWPDGQQDQVRRARHSSGVELEMFCRDNGTSAEGGPSVCKRRYRIANTQLNIAHYLPANAGSDFRSAMPTATSAMPAAMQPAIVQPNIKMSMPIGMRPQQQQQHIRPMQIMPPRKTVLPMGYTANPALSSFRPHMPPHGTPSNHAAAAAAAAKSSKPDMDDEYYSGDELEYISQRDVATARYKRNHEYIAEVFAPLSAREMEEIHKKSVNMDALRKRIEQLKTVQAPLAQDMDKLKQQHEAKVNEMKARRKMLEDEINLVGSLDTAEALDAAVERMRTHFQVDIVPCTPLRPVNL